MRRYLLTFTEGLTYTNARTDRASTPEGALQLKSPQSFICHAALREACAGSAKVDVKRQTSPACLSGIRAVAPCADGLSGERIVREAKKDAPVVSRRSHLQRLFAATVLAGCFHAGLLEPACPPLAPAPAAIDPRRNLECRTLRADLASVMARLTPAHAMCTRGGRRGAGCGAQRRILREWG